MSENYFQKWWIYVETWWWFHGLPEVRLMHPWTLFRSGLSPYDFLQFHMIFIVMLVLGQFINYDFFASINWIISYRTNFMHNHFYVEKLLKKVFICFKFSQWLSELFVNFLYRDEINFSRVSKTKTWAWKFRDSKIENSNQWKILP